MLLGMEDMRIPHGKEKGATMQKRTVIALHPDGLTTTTSTWSITEDMSDRTVAEFARERLANDWQHDQSQILIIGVFKGNLKLLFSETEETF